MARTIRRENTKDRRIYYPTKRARKVEKRAARQRTRRELANYR